MNLTFLRTSVSAGLLSLALSFVALPAANALYIDFDYRGGPPGSHTSLVFADSGFQITVTARKQSGQSILVTQNLGGGLGATYAGDDSVLLDTVGPNEVLNFAITGLPSPGTSVTLKQISFLGGFSINGEDTFNLKIDGANVTTPPFEYNPGVNPWPVSFGVNSNLSIRATPNSVTDGQSEFRVSGMQFQVPDGGITLMLLGLGVAGLAVLRRKLT